MPARCDAVEILQAVIDAHDQVVSHELLDASGWSRAATRHRIRSGQWQRLLPGVFLTHRGEPSRRQLLIAAQLFAGRDAAIDDVDACHYHGVKAAAIDESRVHVVVPDESPIRSRGYVVVRRTQAPIRVVSGDVIRWLEPAAAVIAAARRQRTPRVVLALLSDALQRRVTTYDDLVRAHIQAAPRNARMTDDALEQLGAGVRSAPEGDFRALAQASILLPNLEYNAWLRMPDRKIVCVDALAVSSAVIHETNGRIAHRRDDLFEDMQVRHDYLTSWGFVALHNTPARIRLSGREVISEFERCHVRYDGRGLPDGVVLLDGDPFERRISAL